MGVLVVVVVLLLLVVVVLLLFVTGVKQSQILVYRLSLEFDNKAIGFDIKATHLFRSESSSRTATVR